jgi:mono/diheme cytochrome c family protein
MMQRVMWRIGGGAAVLFFALTVGAAAQYQGWTIPDGAKEEKSPVKNAAEAAAKGKSLFAANCAKCHGPLGKGDGPDSKEAADLTDEFRTELNPEGVLFYKVWNGHANNMPAFKTKLTKDEVWSLVEYLKQLRTPAK